MRPQIIIDLDGTLCDATPRLHHIRKKPKDWTAFFAEMGADKPNNWCLELIYGMRSRANIVFLTGRNESYRQVTLEWLYQNVAVWPKYKLNEMLLMRPAKDRRTDVEWKTQAYKDTILPRGPVLFAVDDRCRIVKMWRSLGVPCLACDDWESREGGEEEAEEIHQHFLKGAGK